MTNLHATGSRSPGTVVLMYHRITPGPPHPLDLSVHPDRFAQHLDTITTRGTVGHLTDLIGPNPPDFVLTFDDAYRDFVVHALPRLEAVAAPATLFVPTMPTTPPDEEYWWDRLDHLLDGPGRDRAWVRLAGRPIRIDRRGPGVDHARAKIVQWAKLQPPAVREAALERVRRALRAPAPVPCGEHSRCRAADLRRLATHPLVTLGAHTRTHPWLASLDDGAQRVEIAGSRADLAALTGTAPRVFAYPYGRPSSISPTTPGIVAAAGFALACLATPTAGEPFDAFRIPRRAVADWTGPALAGRLDEWAAPR